MRVIHWFRSDLRVEDNRALAAACRRASELAPVFVLDDALLRRHRKAHPRLRFLDGCLRELERALEAAGSRLVVLRGDPRRCIPDLARASGASLVTWNRDYGPHAKRRDGAVRRALEREGIEVRTFKDRVVFEGDEIRTGKGEPYSVYSPYRRAWWRRYREAPPGEERVPARIPPSVPPGRLDELAEDPLAARLDRTDGGSSALHAHRKRTGPAEATGAKPRSGSVQAPRAGPRRPAAAELHPFLEAARQSDATAIPRGGAGAARERLDAFLGGGAVRRYHVDRDFPAIAGTSRLSPFLRFGAISVRECIRAGLALADDEPSANDGVAKWLDELVWREFYHAVLDAHPHVLDGPFRPAFGAIEWDARPERLHAWEAGMTGYPFVDAGMRELAATGWMHNRARMVVASFLAKDLHLDWRAGERWFMRRLVDGDPASNNGGWQWAASTGTDAQPWFRIFNPTTQGERFDPDGEYVRRWIPELRGLPGRSVHRPREAPLAARGYPGPIVDHRHEREVALARYRAARVGPAAGNPGGS